MNINRVRSLMLLVNLGLAGATGYTVYTEFTERRSATSRPETFSDQLRGPRGRSQGAHQGRHPYLDPTRISWT